MACIGALLPHHTQGMAVIFAYDRKIVAVNQIWNVSNFSKIYEYRMPCQSV